MKSNRSNFCLFASFLCLVLFVCSLAQAQSPSDPEKIQNIKKLIRLHGGLDDLKQKVDSQITAYCEKIPGLPPEYAESMKKVFDEIDMADLADKFVSAYAKQLTDKEVDGLLKFYESPLGKKVIAVMPKIHSEQSAIAKQWGQNCAVHVLDKLAGLTRAAAIGDIAKVNDLLAQGVDVNAQDPQGVTALIVAAFKGNTDLAKLLVEKGADINAKAKRGSTPLMAAVQSRNKEMVKFLLEKGADANAKEELGLNAYQLALMRRDYELTALLKHKTTVKKPARPGTVVGALGKAKNCIPVMVQASDASKKITCLKLGQEVIPIAGVPLNNGWTLIQYPKLGWVPPETLKQKLMIGEPQRIMAAQPQESVASEAPAEAQQPSAESSYKEAQDAETVLKVAEQPRIWWRH